MLAAEQTGGGGHNMPKDHSTSVLSGSANVTIHHFTNLLDGTDGQFCQLLPVALVHLPPCNHHMFRCRYFNCVAAAKGLEHDSAAEHSFILF